jgi:hypothetical protein
LAGAIHVNVGGLSRTTRTIGRPVAPLVGFGGALVERQRRETRGNDERQRGAEEKAVKIHVRKSDTVEDDAGPRRLRGFGSNEWEEETRAKPEIAAHTPAPRMTDPPAIFSSSADSR